MLAVVNPRRIVQIVDLDAAGAAVIVKAGMVQTEFMAKLVDEAVEHIAANVRPARLCIVKTLADADIAVC